MHNVRVWKLQSQSIVPLLLWVIHPCWSLGSVPTYALLYSADLSVTLMFPVALFVLRHSEFSAAGQKCLVGSRIRLRELRIIFMMAVIDFMRIHHWGIKMDTLLSRRDICKLLLWSKLKHLFWDIIHILLGCYSLSFLTLVKGNVVLIDGYVLQSPIP